MTDSRKAIPARSPDAKHKALADHFGMRLALALIQLYQYTLGPLLGPSCRFLPSCSTYAKEAFQIHGTVQGAYLSFRRLCRCHPFHPGGIDEVPAASLSHGTKPASTPESAKSGKPPFAS